MSKQIVLVIGAMGFIGRHVVTHLAAQGHTVYATHFPTKTPPLTASNIIWIPCDLTNKDHVALWPTRCHSVIYLAQSRLWRDFPTGAADTFEINVAAVIRAVEYARQSGVQRFIYTSSGTVYTQTRQPACENEVINFTKSRSFYAASKLAAELLLGPYADFFSLIILRLFVPYGPGQNPKMLIPRLVQQVRQGEPIRLHGQNGLQANPVAVVDVAETLEHCLTLNQSVTLNVAGPHILSLREMGSQIGKILDIAPNFQPKPDQTPPVVVGDTTLLQHTLDWKPQTSFETGLRAWLTSNNHLKD